MDGEFSEQEYEELEAVPQCLSCLKILTGNVKAVSLDGGVRPQLCMSCFDALPSFRRIQLQAIYRTAYRGGCGFRDVLNGLLYSLEERDEDDESPI